MSVEIKYKDGDMLYLEDVSSWNYSQELDSYTFNTYKSTRSFKGQIKEKHTKTIIVSKESVRSITIQNWE